MLSVEMYQRNVKHMLKIVDGLPKDDCVLKRYALFYSFFSEILIVKLFIHAMMMKVYSFKQSKEYYSFSKRGLSIYTHCKRVMSYEQTLK